MCQSLFLNKVAGLQRFKKETLAQVFSCEFCEICKSNLFTNTSGFPVNFAKSVRATFLQNTSGRLLLLLSEGRFQKFLKFLFNKKFQEKSLGRKGILQEVFSCDIFLEQIFQFHIFTETYRIRILVSCFYRTPFKDLLIKVEIKETKI